MIASLTRFVRLLFIVGVVSVFFGMPALVAQIPQTISRTAPEAFAKRAAPLLTPLSDVLAIPAPNDNEATAQILVDETIHLVEADGRVFRVRQVAYRALKEAGLKPLAEDIFSYGRDRQVFHLVRAAAIHPDGAEHAVASDAILVQSPQRQADMAIYDDTTEVRIIYPRIPVGGVTHAITVVADTAARFSGAYTSRRIWGAGWPTGLDRLVVEMPADLAARLRWFEIGPGAGEPLRETVAEGRTRFVWARQSLRGRNYEVGRAPAVQAGPALQLTTLGEWDEVAAWFQSLLTGRDELPAGLVKQADDWLRDAPDRDAKLRILFSKVADEIRYTSLALNEGDYQPQTCADVWARRHGDCKDKSNLLVALLRHAGIPAHVALVNTSHLGLIDRRAPDYGVFSHAIVAVPDGQGGYTFCDPTIASGYPGLLAPSAADRDALVIRDGRADWVRIPPQSAGRVDYAFELELAANGELSGWLTLTTDRIYGAWERERYRDLDHRDRRDALARIVRGFYPGAEVVDIEPPDPSRSPGPAIARAYFVVPGQGDAVSGPNALRFPQSSWVLLNLGTTETRETAYFAHQDEVLVSATFALPAGTASGPAPAPFRLETPSALIDAGWRVEPGKVRAELRRDFRQSAVSPHEFSRVYQAGLALASWLDQPLTLQVDSKGPISGSEGNAVAIELPLMPTGRGQLDLIERRYPYSGNRAQRRAALQRAVQYFPNDPATAYEAGIHLAVIEWDENRNQLAYDQAGALIAAHRRSVSPGLLAWGESIQALALRDMGRTDEAIAIFSRIARDPSLHAWRRSQDALNALRVLSSRDPAAALQLASDCSTLVSEHQAAILVHFARLSLQQYAASGLRERFEAIARDQPADLDRLLAAVTKGASGWSGPDALATRERWLAMTATLAPVPGPELHVALNEARAAVSRIALATEIQRRLREAVTKSPIAEWYGTAAPSVPETWETYATERKKLVDNDQSAACVRLGLGALLALNADDETLERLWRVASDADWHARRAPTASSPTLFPLLMDLCDLVPKPHDTYYEGRFLRALTFSRRGDYSAERAIFDELLADPQFFDYFRLTAFARSGLCHENLGHHEAALADYRKLESDIADSERNADCVLRAVLINLHQGRRDEALRLIALLEQATEATLLKATGEHFMREFITLRRSGRAEEFWANHETWWPQWVEIASGLRLPAPAGETIVPVIPELTAFGAGLRQAEKDKDAAGFWREFRTVISAARWLPSLAPEISAIIGHAIAQEPNRKAALNRLVASQLAVPGIPDANARLREFHLIATMHDTGDYAGALAAAGAFLDANPVGGPQRASVVRVRAMSALAANKELGEASVELERLLADPANAERRALNVELLAKLYRARQLAEDERTLLQRELANAHVIADQAAHRTLTTRFEQLGGSLDLGKQVRDWLVARPLEWFDYAEPASLNEPRFRDLSAVLENPGRQLTPVEVIKLRLLAAQKPDIGLALQSEALDEAVCELHDLLPTHAEAMQLAESFLGHIAFDKAIRASFLWHLVVDSYFMDRRADYTRWIKHPLAERFNPEQIRFIELMTRSHAVDRDDVHALAQYADELREMELGDRELIQLQEILSHYLRLDEMESARALVESISQWRFSSGYSGSRASNALHFTRVLRAAEERQAVHDALIARLRRDYAAFPAKPPTAFAERRLVRGVLPELAPADTREAGLWMIGAKLVYRQDFTFWGTFIEALHADPATRALALDLIEVAVNASTQDDIRAEVLDALFYTVDYDAPATLARLRAIVEPSTDRVAYPLSARYVRVQNARLAVRLGEEKDFESTLRVLDAGEDGFLRTDLALTRYLQRDDVPALKRLLRDMDPELLLAPGLLHLTVPALQRAGLEAEHRVARAAAEKELRESILSAWVTASGFSITRALNLAEMFGRADAFPSGWVASVTKRCAEPMDRARVLITDAWLRSDWPAVAQAARGVLRDFPTYHRFQWYAGAALERAGQFEEARPHLEIYVRHAHDEIEHPIAAGLLKRSRP